jgi:hypothetical protein
MHEIVFLPSIKNILGKDGIRMGMKEMDFFFM